MQLKPITSTIPIDSKIHLQGGLALQLLCDGRAGTVGVFPLQAGSTGLRFRVKGLGLSGASIGQLEFSRSLLELRVDAAVVDNGDDRYRSPARFPSRTALRDGECATSAQSVFGGLKTYDCTVLGAPYYI